MDYYSRANDGAAGFTVEAGGLFNILDGEGKVKDTGKYTADLAHEILVLSEGFNASPRQYNATEKGI